MTVKLDLSPQVEAGLLAQARTRGLSLEAYLTQMVQEQSRLAADSTLSGEECSTLSGEEWERELDALVTSPDTTVLSEEAMKRENWYSDRG